MAAEDRALFMPVEGEDGPLVVEPQTVRHSIRRRRVIAGGALAAVGASAALLAWKSAGTCKTVGLPAGPVDDAIVSLAETFPKDLVSLAEVNDDLDARQRWLEAASEATDVMQSLPGGMQVPEHVRASIDKAMKTEDPEEAKKVVDRALARAVEMSKKKRRELKDYIKANRRSLKKKKDKSKHTPAQQEAIATCVFDVLGVTTTVAGIAANINDAAKTCWGVDGMDMFKFGLHGKEAVHTNVCAVNVWAILGGMLSLAGSLSSAASDCANTMIPNVDALCATSAIGIVTAVASMGGAATLVKAACHEKGWYHDVPAGTLPSNVGSNEKWVTNYHPEKMGKFNAEMAQRSTMGARRLEESPAPARQLLFGGGKGSTATQCSVEIANTMWVLASAAMAINSAGNLEEGGSCPPKNFLTKSEKPSNSILYRVPQAMCSVDVTSAILGFLSAITFIELAVVNCVDTFHLGAICGAGVTGLMAAATGLAKAGSGAYVACDVAQRKGLKQTINAARNVDLKTGGMLSGMLGGGLGTSQENFGRRLKSKALENVEELKKHFKSPHEVFESLGMNIDDAHSPWRNATARQGTNVQELFSLIREPEKVVGRFFGGETCAQ